jgi:hypothetical protein
VFWTRQPGMLTDLRKERIDSSIRFWLFTLERRHVLRKLLHVNRASAMFRRTREEIFSTRADKWYQSKLGLAKRRTQRLRKVSNA